MNELQKYIPLDKSWIIRMGILDLVNGYDDITKFLDKEKDLGDDLIALKRVAKDWNTNKPLDVGESGTLYRFIRFALWKLKKENEIVKRGTLKNRNICDNPGIIDWPLEKLLGLDNKTSQWASAAYLMGNKKRTDYPLPKLELTYEAVAYWHGKRRYDLCWAPRFDKTIEKQALAYINLLKTGKMDFTPKHSEDYCFARAFDLITAKEGEERFPSLMGHESNRLKQMDELLKEMSYSNKILSRDHRVIQALVMRQKFLKKELFIQNPNAVNKSWPLFFDFIDHCKRKYL